MTRFFLTGDVVRCVKNCTGWPVTIGEKYVVIDSYIDLIDLRNSIFANQVVSVLGDDGSSRNFLFAGCYELVE